MVDGARTMTAPGSASLQRRSSLQANRVEWLRRMHEIRRAEDMIAELFAEGLVHGTTHTGQGQEAVAVGLAAAADATDTVTCTYRGHAVALALGMSLEEMLGEVLGRECGCVHGLGGSMHMSAPEVGLLPTFAIVGAGIPVAVGAALTAQMRGTGRAAIAVFGDGTTNIGAFHESLNLAAVWRLPVVFLCENNLYGEYTPIALSTAVTDLARRADAYAMAGEVVDGQDADAVQDVLAAALERARAGRGPTLVEAKTYRYAGHSRSDAGTYRPPGELDRWRERDPLTILERRLIAEGLLSAEAARTIREQAGSRVADAARAALASPEPDPAAMFAHTYAPGSTQWPGRS
jgi:acetoin:2,6-dichlorophenolindophenol oxidoreductase subunit alpha